jgi:type I restriction enzyme S subunit
LAERILPALFYDMFGDPASNPKGWPVVPLGDVISDTRNGLYKHADYYGRGTQILKMYNIQAGVLHLARIDLVELTDDELDAYRLIPGDILLNRVNTPELVGKCAVIPASLGEAVFESKNIRVRLDSKRVTPEYVAHYLNSSPGHAALRSSVKHAIGMATVNNEGLRSVVIPLPPLPLQRVWSRAVRSNDETRHNRADSKRIADTLLDVLLHRAFSGELTAKWREKNKALVESEMAEQKRILKSLADTATLRKPT